MYSAKNQWNCCNCELWTQILHSRVLYINQDVTLSSLIGRDCQCPSASDGMHQCEDSANINLPKVVIPNLKTGKWYCCLDYFQITIKSRIRLYKQKNIMLYTNVTLTRYLSHQPRNIGIRKLVPCEDCDIIQDGSYYPRSIVQLIALNSYQSLGFGKQNLRSAILIEPRYI